VIGSVNLIIINPLGEMLLILHPKGLAAELGKD